VASESPGTGSTATTMLLSLAALALLLPALPQDDVAVTPRAVLQDFYRAGAETDLPRYLGHLAPDVLFLGSAPGQRMCYDTFLALVGPVFQARAVPAMQPVEQEVHLLPGGRMAWFRERLVHPELGAFRSTGVLRQTRAGWQIVQYDVAFLIPNDLVPDFVRTVRALPGGPEVDTPPSFPAGLDRDSPEPTEAVRALLVAFHESAARGDAEAHFACLDEDGIILTTDASERFPTAAYQRWIGGWFEQGVRVVSIPVRQGVRFNATRDIAWFDEDLVSQRWGAMRSTGVALRRPEGWKIAFYNLVFPVPDPLLPDLAARVREAGEKSVLR